MEGEILRDDQWERIKTFVPGGHKGRCGPRSDGRRFFNAILWLARSGARWRDLPEDRFGPYQTVKRCYYRWIETGVFHPMRTGCAGLLPICTGVTPAKSMPVREPRAICGRDVTGRWSWMKTI